MRLSSKKLCGGAIVGSFSLFVVACGGSDSGTQASSEVALAPEAVESAASEVEDTGDAANDAVEAAANMATDVMDAAEGVVDDAAAAADEVTEEAQSTVNVAVAAVNDAASGAYAALTGDAAKGRRVFAKCMSCHTMKEGQNRVGPSLYGIMGSEAGSVEGFNYSDGNANSGIVWTEDVMFEYLENPQEYIPGTRMIFPGLPSEQDRADVIAYMKTASN